MLVKRVKVVVREGKLARKDRKFGFDLLREQTLGFAEGMYDYNISQVEVGNSEIEKLFCRALHATVMFGDSGFSYIKFCSDNDFYKKVCDYSTEPEEMLLLRSQVDLPSIGIVDFIISAIDHSSVMYDERGPCLGEYRVWQNLIVECDGHDFHERTKEQAAKDRSRDREATLKDFEVFRFTGSELWRDPWGCAAQVIHWANKYRG